MALKYLDRLELFIGATSIICLELSNWNFVKGQCLFTIRDMTEDTIFREELISEAPEGGQYQITIGDSESLKLKKDNIYKYDIMCMVGEERLPACLMSPIKLIEVVGREVNE